MLEIITALLKLITPNPDMKDIRLERKEIRLEKKKLRIAKRMLTQIKKEFKKDGLTEEEQTVLDELNFKILERQKDLIMDL